MRDRAIRFYSGLQARVMAVRGERGDLVGWLLIAVMTALLVAAIWGTMGGRLQRMIEQAIGEAESAGNF